MKAIVHLRNQARAVISVVLDMEASELVQLIRDFDNYRQKGIPTGGTYNYLINQADLARVKDIELHFENIERIEYILE